METRLIKNQKLTFNDSGELLVYVDESVETFTADYSEIKSDLEIITPTTDYYIEIKDIFVSSATGTGSVSLTGATSGTLFKVYLTNQQSYTSGKLHLDLTTNEKLRVSCPANTFIAITYYLDN